MKDPAKGGDPDPLGGHRGERVMRIRRQIANREYRVDPEAVAREMLFKLRLVSLSRRALLADPAGGDDQRPRDERS